MTGDMGVIALMGLLYWPGNLAHTFYTYIYSHLVAIFLAYLLFYLVLSYFVNKVERSLIHIDRDNISHVNSEPKLEKGKYKYSPSGTRPSKQRKNNKVYPKCK